MNGSSHYLIIIDWIQICELRGDGHHPLDGAERSESIRGQTRSFKGDRCLS